ncbi:hypothetical protein H2200_003417 [Cladophialophora chaetospira]|uniref:Uncharacterized protein n=1 Tax=Cladophialophora chaetospira TaxID=386627 RepID=A0AA39CM94_9EURO|nr:hypothetical protein H2200_003417 [Cladophialophora chaetospira]
MTTSSVAALIFGATYRPDATYPNVSIAIWLATSLTEAVLLLSISWQWKSLSICKTNLVERMGTLTLIVMGEGIIAMTDSISRILRTLPTPSGVTFGLSIAVIATCYSIWILYSDHTNAVDKPKSGKPEKPDINHSPHRQIWAILHFPLHFAILMTLKGCAAFMLWWVAVEALTFGPILDLFNLGFSQLPSNYTALTGSEIHAQLKHALDSITDRYIGNITQTSDIEDNLRKISTLGLLSDDSTLYSAWDLTYNVGNEVYSNICSQIGFENSEGNASDTTSKDADRKDPSNADIITQFFAEFEGFWFVTLFVAAGSTLMILAILRWLYLKGDEDEGKEIRPGTSRFRRVKKELKSSAAVLAQFLIGAALATVAIMNLDQYSNPFNNYIFSAWIVPTVFLTYLFVIIIDNFLYPTYSNVHHPPLPKDNQDEENEMAAKPKLPVASLGRREMRQRPPHDRNSSASALLTPRWSPDDYELGERSRSPSRTRDPSPYRDEENYPRAVEEEGLGA